MNCSFGFSIYVLRGKKNWVLYNLISTAQRDTDWKTAPAFSFMFTEQHSGGALGEVWRMSIKGLFKYLSNKVCKSSLGCSCWRGGEGGGNAASALQGAAECQAGSVDSWEASRLGLQCELKLTLRSAPHNDLQKTADKRVYFKAGQRGG